MPLHTGIALQKESLDRDLKSLEYDIDVVSSNIETASAFAKDDGVEIFFGYSTTIPVIINKRAGKVMSISIDKNDVVWATVKMDEESDDMPWQKVKYSELEMPEDVKALVGQYILDCAQEAIAYKSTASFNDLMPISVMNASNALSGFVEDNKTYEEYLTCLNSYPKTVKSYFFEYQKCRKLHRLIVKSSGKHIKYGTDKNGHRYKRVVNNEEVKKVLTPNVKNCLDYATAIIKGGKSLNRLSPEEELGRKEAGNFAIQATVYLGANEETDRNALGSRGDDSFRNKQKERIIEISKKSGHYLKYDSLDTSSSIQGGVEAEPYKINNGSTIMKVVDPCQLMDDVGEYLDRIAMHNTIEKNAQYVIVGVTNHPDYELDDMDGFRFVVYQPYIQVIDPEEWDEESDSGLTQDEITEFMEEHGFSHKGGTTYYNEDMIIDDVRKANIVRDVYGTMVFIDPIVQINDDKSFGGKRKTNKIDINDTNELIIPESINTELMNLINDKYNEDYDISSFTPKVINNGWCDEWARLVMSKFGGEFWYTDHISDGSNTNGHSFVKIGHKYYDAESPFGVKDIFDLEYFKRAKSHYGDKWNQEDAMNYINNDKIQKAMPKNKHIFTDGERQKLAKTGEAMPDGSFPIRNEQDLKDAIKAYGRAKDQASAKAHIMKRAKALGKESELPEEWKEPSDTMAEMEEVVKKSFANPINGKLIQNRVAIKLFTSRC